MSAAPGGLPLADGFRLGLTAGLFSRADVRETVALAEGVGLDSLWVGDHVAFTSPINDPFVQLAQVAALSDTLGIGTSVYLLPLRAPAAAAKQAATLDNLSEGRFVFGLGIGGEFPAEFAACGVDPRERGARLSEGIDVMRALWSGEPVAHEGRFWSFPEVRLQPPPHTPGGPPIWCAGRKEPALRRVGRKADGWISYVVTPDQYRAGLETIAAAASAAGRTLARFDTAHLLYVRIADTRERALDEASAILSRRYAMDFRRAADRYCGLGAPAEVAETIERFRAAGVRTLVVDLLGTKIEQRTQLERLAAEVRPLLAR